MSEKLQQSLSAQAQTVTKEEPISEAFEQEMTKMQEAKAPAQPTPMVQNITTSLADIEIIDDSELMGIDFDSIVTSNLDHITKSGVSVVCLQSAYSAEMGPINMKVKSAITNSKVSAYEYNRKLFAAIYNSINHMSFPKPGFDIWLKVTSYLDLEILYYGMYSKTYTNDSQFDVTCGNCETKLKAVINPNSVIQVKDEEVYTRIDTVSKEVTSPAGLRDHSLISRTFRTKLDKTNFIVDVAIPSLHDYLELIRNYANSTSDDVKVAIGSLLYIKSLMIPHPQNGKYVRVNSPETLIRLLNNLPDSDIEQLDEYIREKTAKYTIEFKIPQFNCTNCGNEIGPLPLDMEQLVFMKAVRKL